MLTMTLNFNAREQSCGNFSLSFYLKEYILFFKLTFTLNHLCFILQWLRVLVAVSVTARVWSQHAYARVQQNGKGFEWSWQLTPVDSVPAEQFYVQLPQPVQGVQYASNVGVLQTTAPLLDGSGQETVGYNHAVPIQIYENPSLSNNTQITHNGQSNGNSVHTPVDIYLLQQQLSLPVYQTVQGSLPGDLIHYTNIQPNLFNLNTLNPTGYNFQTNHLITNNQEVIDSKNNDRSSKDLNPITSHQEIGAEQNHIPVTSVVQVFRDHNCSNEDLKTENKFYNNTQKSTELVAEITTYDKQNINENFENTDQQNELLSYKGATDFKIEQPIDNTNKEGFYYYSTETSPISTGNTNIKEEDSISRLVASTQDLISNDDLLRINHSAEKHLTEIYDDYIKPRSRFNLKSEETRYIKNPRNHITVKAKISNIENRAIESLNNDVADKIQKDNYESGKFTSPIIVEEFSDADYKEQVLNTLVSTMDPYIENGYEIVNIKKDSKGNHSKMYVPHYFNEETVYVTPRPVGQRYLAPITVALRLLNSNHTDDLNSIDDHDTSDTELVEKTVKSPSKERTIVEIQESIPLDIIHINDVEVHEYLEEGRSNSNPFDMAKILHNTYMKVLQFTKKNEDNINDVLNNYNKNHDEYSDSNYNDDDQSNENNHEIKEKLEPSENMQSEVQFISDDISNMGYENKNYYDNHNANISEATQPIIIEKEVPVPQYQDRYTEKQVPEPVEVVKHIPVDRPVLVPVPYEKVIEKPVEVTKYIEKPYPVQVPQPYPVAVKVPYPVEQKVFIDRPVQIPYPVEKLVEKQIIKTLPVPTPVAVPFKVHVPVEKPVLYPVAIEKPILVPIEKPVPVEKIFHKEVPVPYPVEKTILYPVLYEKKVHVPYPVEKQVPFPVEKIVEKQRQVPVIQVVKKPVDVNVPVPVPVHIVKHYPVDRIVEKKVPNLFPVDRIVEQRVPVKVPYSVENFVDRLVQKPAVFTKYIDRPYQVETKVPHIVEKIIEKKLPYAVQIPYTASSLAHGNSEQESQNLPNYHQYQGQSKQNPSPVQNNQDHQAQQGYLNQYYQYLKERQQTYSVPVQTTQWGKLYASSFKYLNVTPEDSKDTKEANGVTYLTINKNTYYGPPPVQFYGNMWEKNSAHISEVELKRSDRTPKVTNIRLEYGFKPPLIPSTEVDLDGRPINKESDT
ncbi:unnamed protein product [Parnassius mnemosyne]|uniref:Uncharacterized protein n=1 Tax=Parnassius mnemosyne TaxID=213953 RepID=A0AAV1LI90_9NEOP